MTEFPYTLLKEGHIEWEIKRSRFLGDAYPVTTEEEALEYISMVKKREKGARHHCSAYVVGKQGVYQRYSDDGEPQGTAGIPMLEVLKKTGITNIVVIATRYFGGIKLGAAGLARAYAKTCQEAVAAGFPVKRDKYRICRFVLDYSKAAEWDYRQRQHETVLELEKSYSEAVTYTLAIAEDAYSEIAEELRDFTDGQISVEIFGVMPIAVKDGKALEEVNWKESIEIISSS